MSRRINNACCGIFPIHPPSQTSSQDKDYPLVKAACHYTVVDVNVHARLTQTYVSTALVAQDIKYVFPLPSNAAVCSFKATIDDTRTIHGIVKQKEDAKREYDQAVAAGKTAGLLAQHTADVFEVSLGNLNPRQKIAVEISYVSIVAHDGKLDTLRLTVPLSIAPNYGALPASLNDSIVPLVDKSPSFELTLAFSLAYNIASITSQTHPISLTLGAHAPDAPSAFDATKAHVSLTTANMLDKDVILVLKADKLDHPRCVVERVSRQDGVSDAIALTLVPRFNVPSLPEQEYIFLIDRSGSMGGGRIAAVRTALQIMLRSLPSRGTTFNLFSFGSHCDSLWPKSVEYSSDTVEHATQYVDGMASNYGGTEIRAALEMAFASRKAANRDTPTMMLLLTDGEAWDVEGVVRATNDAVADSKNALRVFVLGVGDKVSTNMCDSIARAGHGISAYVTEQEKPDAKLMNMLKAARGAAIEDVSIDWDVPGAVGSPSYPPEDLDSFEIVERNDPPVASPPIMQPISLFDINDTAPTPEVSLGPVDAPIVLPPVPCVQQSDISKLGALYPSFRTSLFAIIQQPSHSAPLPVKVVIRGNVLGAPVQLEVPVTRVPAQTETSNLVHVLAARAFVQQLEDISDKSAIVKAHIVRLATTYGIASSQTSFIAVDEKGDATYPAIVSQRQPVSSPALGGAASGRTRSMRGIRRTSDTTSSSRSSSTSSPVANITGGLGQSSAQRVPASSATAYLASGLRRSITSSMSLEDDEAVPRGAAVSVSSTEGALGDVGGAPPPRFALRIPRIISKRKSAQTAPSPMAAVPFSSTPTESAEPVHARAQVSTRESVPEPSESAPTVTVETFARLQRFDGSFASTETFFALVGFVGSPTAAAAAALSAAVSGTSNENVRSTLLAIAFLRLKFADEEDAWALLAEKARDYVVQSLVREMGVDESAAGERVEDWIKKASGAIV